MSTDYGIGCRTCRAAIEPLGDRELRARQREFFSGEWDNCRDTRALQRLIDARAEVVAAWRKLGGLVCFSWSEFGHGASGVASFFAEHAGHDLAPMDEYLRFDEQCYKHARCAHCGQTRDCKLKVDHDGECA